MVLAYSSWAIHERFFNKTACINFIDVGLGEAILIEAPSGTRILIDGGGFYGSDFDTGKSVIAPILLSKKIRTLDYVINTHRHGDHAKGLVFIVNNFHVGHFVTGPLRLLRGIFQGTAQNGGKRSGGTDRNLESR